MERSSGTAPTYGGDAEVASVRAQLDAMPHEMVASVARIYVVAQDGARRVDEAAA